MDKETRIYRLMVLAILGFIAYQIYYIDDKSFYVDSANPLSVKIDN